MGLFLICICSTALFFDSETYRKVKHVKTPEIISTRNQHLSHHTHPTKTLWAILWMVSACFATIDLSCGTFMPTAQPKRRLTHTKPSLTASNCVCWNTTRFWSPKHLAPSSTCCSPSHPSMFGEPLGPQHNLNHWMIIASLMEMKIYFGRKKHQPLAISWWGFRRNLGHHDASQADMAECNDLTPLSYPYTTNIQPRHGLRPLLVEHRNWMELKTCRSTG